MEYNDKTLMTDDYLKVLKFISSDIFRFKFVKILLWVVLLVHVSATLITAYFMIYVLDSNETLSYSAVLLGTFYIIIATLVVIFKGEIIANVKKDFKIWSIDSAGGKIRSRINQQIKLITALVVISLIIALIGSVLHFPTRPIDDNIFFMLRFSREYSFSFEIIYKMTYPLVAHIMIVPTFQAVYYIQHMKFQIIMFKKYVVNVDNCADGLNEKELFYNEEYQTNIRNRLIFCIDRYSEFLRTLETKLKETSNLIALFAVAGCLLGISILMNFFLFHITAEYYPRVVVMSLAASLVFSVVIWSSQSTETEMEDVVVITEIRWYNFNKLNKVLYLIFLMNIMKNRRIRFTENYSLNYELGLAIVRGIYSVISVLASIQ